MNEWVERRIADTKAIEREALQLGIPLPKDHDWWDSDADDYSGPADQMEFVVRYWLTDFGVAGSRKLIQAERRRLEEQRRADIEWRRQAAQWRLTVAGTIIGWIIAILSLLTAILALRLK